MTVDQIVRWFETLSRESVARASEIYAPDAFFKDPFNEVRGADRIERIFAHMFDQVESPRFLVHGRFSGEQGVMLVWDFTFRASGRSMLVRGVSELRFAADGRVLHHRDYWDVAEELYEKFPVLGALMRFLKRRLAAS